MVPTAASRILLVAALAVAGLGVSASTASACSCAFSEPAEMIAAHDAGFIGTATKVRGLGWGDRRWTFQVQRWVKGDLGGTVTVSAPASGASCGFELELGQEAAIFLRLEGDVARGGLCSTVDADAVRAHLDPPPPSTGRRATTLVAGGSGGPYLWLFDDDGGLVASKATSRRSELVDYSVCPGGRRLVEVWERRVVVRSLETLRRLRTVAVPEDVGRVWCNDRRARSVLVARTDDESGDWSAIAPLGALGEPLVRGAWVDVEIVGDRLLATVGREHTELRLVSLYASKTALLHVAADHTGAPLSVEPAIEGFAVSPDAERVAFEVTRYPAQGRPSSEVFVYDLATRQLLARAGFDVEGGAVGWLDESQLVLSAYEHPPLVLGADDLSVRAELPADAFWVASVNPDGDLIGMDGPRLAAVTPATGAMHVLATVPTQFAWYERLAQPVRVSAAAQRRSRAAAKAASAGSPVPGGPSEDAPVRGDRSAVLLPGAAGVLVLTGLVWTRRRCPPRRQR